MSTVQSIFQKFAHGNISFYIRILVLFTALSLSVLSILAPLRQSLYGFPSGESIYRMLAMICHQLPARSFWILDFPCGLCSRCLLGYTGLAIAALFVSCSFRYSKRLMIGSALLLPGIADGLIQLMTSYESTNIIRAATGLTGGIGLFILLSSLNFFSRREKIIR